MTTPVLENKASSEIRLPFWETVRRSFLYVIFNFPALWKISCLWFVVLLFDIFTGYPTLCNIDETYCRQDWAQNLSIIFLAIAAIAIMVAFSRFVIMQEQPLCCHIRFGKRELKYLGYALLLILTITIVGTVFGLVYGVFNIALLSVGMNPAGISFTLFSLLPLLILVVAVIYVSRFYLVYPAIAVENREVSLKQSWKMTKGNACRIFFGQALLSIPTFASLLFLSLLFKAFGLENMIFKIIFSFLLVAISFIDSAFKASFFAHAYQYFIYFDKKEKVE